MALTPTAAPVDNKRTVATTMANFFLTLGAKPAYPLTRAFAFARPLANRLDRPFSLLGIVFI